MNSTSAEAAAPNRVTIVVPIYGHWESLRACVLSLIEHADPGDFDVLLVNDCGPDADEIEAGLRALTIDQPQIRYHRNPENLGFVKTCNRAAFELDNSANDILLLNSDTIVTAGALDELRRVLAISERHGVVCPRSNEATIASIPFMHRDPATPRESERAAQVFAAVRDELPRYYVSPVAVGFCFLIRRSLITNHGLFDEIFGRGYNEENDFCMRINALGYSSLIANHAFVHHVGSTSFGAEQRSELEQVNSRILLERYPFYVDAVVEFIKNGYDPIDRFSDVIVSTAAVREPKVLIDLHHVSPHWDGSSRNAISLLEHLQTLSELGADVTIAAQDAAIEFFDLRRFNLRVVDHRTIDEPFDVGFAVAPITELDQLVTLNRYCLRWVASYLDIIALRSWEMRMMVPWKPVVVRSALTHADMVVAITQASIDDAIDFFPELADVPADRLRVLHQGTPEFVAAPGTGLSDRVPDEAAKVIRQGGYVFVVGNSFPHKQVAQALSALSDVDTVVVALGDPAMAERFPGVTILPSGLLTDSDIAKIYANSSVVIFPTAYEGFGLPLAEAAKLGKPVLAFDTVVAREVTAALGLGNHVTFFDRFDLLVEKLETVGREMPEETPVLVRTMEDYNRELWQTVLDVADRPIDLRALRSREQALRDISVVVDGLSAASRKVTSELDGIRSGRAMKLAQVMSRLARPVRRALGR